MVVEAGHFRIVVFLNEKCYVMQKKDAIRTEMQGNLQVTGELKQLLGCLKKMAGVLHSFYIFLIFNSGTF